MPSGHDKALPSSRAYASSGLSPTSRMRIPPTMKAATTAIRGNRSSRASFGIKKLSTDFTDNTENLCYLWIVLVAAGHQQADFFQGRDFWIDLARDASFMKDQ